MKTLSKRKKPGKGKLKVMKKRKESVVKSQGRVHKENQEAETGLLIERAEELGREAALVTAVNIVDTDMI